jgi:hypothetical protein
MPKVPTSPYTNQPRWGWGLLAGLVLAVILFLFIQYIVRSKADVQVEDLAYEFEVPAANMHRFTGIEGPYTKSVVPPEGFTSWHNYETGSTNQIAILLTDTTSSWLGMVQGMQSAGLPFCLTTSVDKALRHNMVLIYPNLKSNYFSKEEINKLADYSREPSSGGEHKVLCAFGLTGGGLEEAFGVRLGKPSKTRFNLLINNQLPISRDLREPEELAWRLGDSVIYKKVQVTLSYQITGKATYPLVRFDKGDTSGVAVSYRQLDTGPRLLAWGIDLGDYVLRNYNGRGYEGFKSFVNAYEPGIDVLFLLLRKLYQDADPSTAVTLWPVPDGKGLELNITHDVDYTKSIVNGVKFAEWEKQAGIKATYFVQTKYIKDWNDDLFLNNLGAKCISHINALGMEISSHSVAHSYVYNNFPMGTGTERYPNYQPFVMERYKCYNGSILGELRVSRFLIQHFAPGAQCLSFRPGHLSNPLNLPEALLATGYRNLSTIPACMAQSYRPFYCRYGRSSFQQLPIVELPIAVEDEKDGPMINRIAAGIRLGRCIARYGGYYNALLHTDTLGQKLEYEKQLVAALRPIAHITTVAESGDWYQTLLGLQIRKTTNGQLEVLTANPYDKVKSGLTLLAPSGFKIVGKGITPAGRQNLFILPAFQARMTLSVIPT